MLQLPARQRLALAGFLLEMGDATDHPEVDEAWEQEIQDRIKAVDSGVVTGISYNDVIRGSTLWILAVAHSARKPEYWINRKQEG